jgi:hypothetical protein
MMKCVQRAFSTDARKDHVAVAYLSAIFRAWSLETSIKAFRPGR